MSNWSGLRTMFLQEYGGLRRKWQSHFAQLVENGMEEDDAADGADEMIGIGLEDVRVKNFLLKKGMVPDEEAPKADESKGQASDVKNVRWVADNLSNPDAAPKTAPSPTAWNMLVFARSTSTNTAKFWSDLFKPIMLPAKKDLESTSRHVEDEDRLLGIIDQVKHMAVQKDDS